ncbi:MAG TPA: hypothetical protein VM914_13930, partial [Pyrinomonadaceae bacterium]|nr:hypothetical protein [Pyrinomonadaceae bacterium]
MFFLFQHGQDAGAATTQQHAAAATEHAAAAGGHAAESGGHEVPALVQFVNHHIGEPVHHFQVEYTRPLWDKFFSMFGTTAENVFGKYTVENAVPWYTVMFVLAVLFTLALIWVMKPRKLSVDEPSYSQMTLEA